MSPRAGVASRGVGVISSLDTSSLKVTYVERFQSAQGRDKECEVYSVTDSIAGSNSIAASASNMGSLAQDSESCASDTFLQARNTNIGEDIK